MTAAPDTGSIEREIVIAARPETVFPYFIDPERIVRWMGTTAELDATPGGIFRIDYNGKDIARGEFVVVDAPRRVVFTWGWEAPGDATPPGASTVEVTLTPEGDGTRVRLRHFGLQRAAIDGHAEGWDHFLATLVEVAAA